MWASFVQILIPLLFQVLKKLMSLQLSALKTRLPDGALVALTELTVGAAVQHLAGGYKQATDDSESQDLGGFFKRNFLRNDVAKKSSSHRSLYQLPSQTQRKTMEPLVNGKNTNDGENESELLRTAIRISQRASTGATRIYIRRIQPTPA